MHDLRHSHASWLIAAKVPLPAIQARPGHESITTTVDRYGHLLAALDDEIIAAVEWGMNPALSFPETRMRIGSPRLCQRGPTHETPANRPVAVHGHENTLRNRVSAE
ncbi:tyrosine-type recombinase/integrase [Streptomyces sp. FIT100]|uniref:tyrosine-type recombinase/integrase n=1 Tax=Streptomyces sp. FIT100 TaxID=2837956 RepID=UPI0021C79283|nr:tyrosine-type recombinase/integrase [Streptomyces sp. FIT100]